MGAAGALRQARLGTGFTLVCAGGLDVSMRV